MTIKNKDSTTIFRNLCIIAVWSTAIYSAIIQHMFQIPYGMILLGFATLISYIMANIGEPFIISEKITEEQAKHIIDPATSKIAADSELKPALEKYGETTAELYEDLEGNKEVIQALNEADKTKFDTAIDDLVSKKTITKDRADILKGRFTKEEFERIQRTDNEVNEEGKNRAGETVPFSKYNKPSQRDIQDALKVDPIQGMFQI